METLIMGIKAFAIAWSKALLGLGGLTLVAISYYVVKYIIDVKTAKK